MRDDCRFSFSELWEEIDRAFVTAKNSQGALLAISSIYRRATPAQQNQADAEISDWLQSDNNRKRFDARVLISDFHIVSALTGLRDLAAKLRKTQGPEARAELCAVEQVIRELTEAK